MNTSMQKRATPGTATLYPKIQFSTLSVTSIEVKCNPMPTWLTDQLLVMAGIAGLVIAYGLTDALGNWLGGVL